MASPRPGEAAPGEAAPGGSSPPASRGEGDRGPRGVDSTDEVERGRDGLSAGGLRGAGDLPPLGLAVLDSTLGPVYVAAGADGIHGLELRTSPEAFAASVARRTGRPTLPISDADVATRAVLHRLEVELAEHLLGTRQAFDIPVVVEGVSDWDRRVLDGVRSIPRGVTASYGEVARRIGSPGAARAVGGAVGRNPVGLLIPCHRVIAGDGTLGGYGGSWFGSRAELLALKRALLAVEGVAVP